MRKNKQTEISQNKTIEHDIHRSQSMLKQYFGGNESSSPDYYHQGSDEVKKQYTILEHFYSFINSDAKIAFFLHINSLSPNILFASLVLFL